MRSVLLVVHPILDFNVRHAPTTVVMGYIHGFEQLGVPARYVKEPDLEQALDMEDDLVLYLGYDNYNRLTDAALRKIRDVPHCIGVPMWCDGIEQQLLKYNLLWSLNRGTTDKILNSNARFLFTTTTEKYYEFWESWIKSGIRFESLPEACDTTLFFPPHRKRKFTDVEVAFVGGYRDYKEDIYAQFLWPYEGRLALFGYSEWPKCNRGYLPNEDEALLYRDAKVVPAIGEPFQWQMGTYYERPFKVLGSGGLTITDTSPPYRELFTDKELLVPDTLAQYYEMMHLALTDESFNKKWRRRGRKAVLERHTYKHRAAKILEML